MSAITEGPITFQEKMNEESASSPEVVILFVGISLLLGIASRHLLRGTRVPYTVALLLLGVGLGTLEYGTHRGLGKLGVSIRLWSKINPNLILFVFLPALLFESSFTMEIHQIKRCMAQMVLLAGPGVVISTFALGIAIHYLFPYGWNWKISLLLGGLLSATDPVAVVALLKELGASKKLSTIIEGESLMNDGVAIVIYRLFFKMVLGETYNAAEVIKFLSRVALGAVALGLAFGIVSALWLGIIFNDTVIEITLTLTVSYVAYFTAEDAAEVSGVLTVMTIGIFYAAFARTAFKGESQQSMHHFWEMVAYIANTMIFILSGVVIAESILEGHNTIKGHSWGYLILLYIFLQLSRVIVVGMLYPGLRYFGYGLDWKEAAILVWSGLRGAVALALALSVNRASENSSMPQFKEKTGVLFVFFTGGVVFLTLIVNGSTTQFLLRFLGMEKASEIKMRIVDYTRYEMRNKALEAFEEMGEDEELGPVDWPSVAKYITCLKMLQDGEQTHPHHVSMNENELHQLHLQDTRVRLLNGVQAAYWGMLEEGRITQTTAILLMQSVDEALDSVVSHQVLCDWNGLKAHVRFPGYFKYLQMKFLPQKLMTYFTVEILELACYICAAFLRAHRVARRQLREFIGNSEVANIVIRESEAEGEAAKQFLEDVRLTFPQVLRVVKTKQVTYSILSHLSEYVQNLEKSGILEAKEMNQLHDAVQVDLKKLLRNPPLVKMPTVNEILSSQPLLGALPSTIREPLINSAKEMMLLRGSLLYRKGSKPNGIWIIANGVVKWKSESNANRHLLHPTFSHGSTLGLYEALTGKPYLCDLIADSIVHCFFIETEKVLLAFQSTPKIADFFWQESAIVITKLVLPEQFEEMPMQELRALVLERSTMHVYLRGEVIEIFPYAIGIVLEGFIKLEDKEGFKEAPTALIPSNAEHHLTSQGSRQASLSHQGDLFQAESRSRIIIFYFTSIHNECYLHRASGSFLSHSLQIPGRLSYEHEGLLSWPEKQYNTSEKTSDNIVIKPSSNVGMSKRLSAKAMELSVFGSTVNVTRYGSRGSLGRIPWWAGSRSRSYPTVPSQIKKLWSTSTLPSAQSERGPAMRRRLRSQGYIGIEPVRISPKPRCVRRSTEDSSEGSDGEEEHIVQIDSPSGLFRHHFSH